MRTRASRRLGEDASPYLFLASLVSASTLTAATPAPGERDIPHDLPRPQQRIIVTSPPSAPEATPVDPGAPLPRRSRETPPTLSLTRVRGSDAPAQPPGAFNPDPGAMLREPTRSPEPPLFTTHRVDFAAPEHAPVPAALALPRASLERPQLVSISPAAPGRYGFDPVPPALQLPRSGLRENRFIRGGWQAPEHYPLSTSPGALPPHTTAAPDRWRQTSFVPWHRYAGGVPEESPYGIPQPARWHPYRQSVFKGDLPYRGTDRFLSLTGSSESSFETRRVPLATSTPGAFVESDVDAFITNLAFQAEWYRGATVFRPVDWRIRIKPVLGVNHVAVRGDPVSRASPFTGRLSLHEAFVERNLRTFAPNYDFVSLRVGNQGFNSDFRGLIFNDTNFGARLFGNFDSNRWQYNLAVFDLREKDTFSELNTFDRRGQLVVIANAYRHDFGRPGYTAQWSLHASFDEGDAHRDDRGIVVRPAILGAARPHRVNSAYLGWAGDGHLGRWNLSHAVYAVLGRDDFNPLANQAVNVRAHLAAIELSHDRDWIRWKISFLHASGDRDPRDKRATGFDAIIENAHFTGGPFSYFTRQGLELGAGGSSLKPRFSLLPNLRTSKAASQQNFVNPGLALLGVGADLALTPRLRAFAHANHIRFSTTAPLRSLAATTAVDREFGHDASLGVQWRPLLTENIIVSAGGGLLRPGAGYRELYRRGSDASARVLHSVVTAVAFTY